MKRSLAIVAAWILAAACSAFAQETTVTKTVAPFDRTIWQAGKYKTAFGGVTLSDESAPGLEGGCMRINPHYRGDVYRWFSVEPTKPLVIPGRAQRITLRIRRSDEDYGMRMGFRDGWGREEIDGKKLDWNLPFGPVGQWQTVHFDIPADWVAPITITGLSTNNWAYEQESGQPAFWIDELQITTDLADVDNAGKLTTWQPEENPADPAKALKNQPEAAMLELTLATGEPSNVFSRREPAFNVRVMSWKPGELTGRVSYKVLGVDGQVAAEGSEEICVSGATSLDVSLDVQKFGPYTLEVTAELFDGTTGSERLGMARIPAWRDLTAQQKLASPYGLNIHGGGARVPVEQFKRAGVVWFRDYSWAMDWMRNARGEDLRYSGWPNYPATLQRYADAGVMVLPCMQRSMTEPEVKNGQIVGEPGPSLEYVRDLAQVLLRFPQPLYWELDNEYDLHQAQHGGPDENTGWVNYGLWHAKFGEVIRMLGGGRVTAVEQGRAGIWPDRVEQMVREGYFDDIGVVNSHHYCGVDAPEVNYGNFNTGFGGGGQPPMLFYDRLRLSTRAAVCDGKPRQHWLTEFGWDTQAGKVVSPRQQAAYLARAYMLATAAGVDKSFWFWHYDATNPQKFFDGCGMLTAHDEPKLSFCAMAGLTSILWAPSYLGDINAGVGTAGYVFENDGKLVAALWNIADDNGPTVRLQCEQLYDYLGNSIEGDVVKLTMAPVYAVGFSRDDPLFRQTAYSLDTPYLVLATAGDKVRPVLQISNNRDETVECTITRKLPVGWTSEFGLDAIRVPAGGRQLVELPFTLAGGEPLGMREVLFTIAEGEQVKQIVLKVLVQRPLVMQVGAVRGEPGETTIEVQVGNRSVKPLSGTLSLELPDTWQAAAQPQRIGLEPGQDVTVPVSFRWDADWPEDQQAAVVFDAGGGRVVRQSIIPNHFSLVAAEGLTMDGDLSDWPTAAELPAWLLGSSMGETNARILMAWAPEGLYCAVETTDSQAVAPDPRNFWEGDALELFVATAPDRTPRAYQPGDHQFWIVPLVEANRVYAGQWKNNEEIEATRYDVPLAASAARRTDDGYVMEFLLPAEQMVNYAPAAGDSIGLNVNLTVKGEQFNREVYWPWVKDESVRKQPANWGTVKLAE